LGLGWEKLVGFVDEHYDVGKKTFSLESYARVTVCKGRKEAWRAEVKP
jgi:hypothetical protein